ncbi:MAG TPA: hypothetical protein P5568_05790 [Acidobacteriota bacterium]|nr:hypothetical protein [Acidobacteriota bacterium]
MSARSILVATLGESWPVIPEAYSFCNPDRLDLWKSAEPSLREDIQVARERHQVRPVDEIWIVTTCGATTAASLQQAQGWLDLLADRSPDPVPILRAWRSAGIEDPSSYEQCLLMRDLIFRVVLLATEYVTPQGQLLLSLAGGRKAMSADLQAAAVAFGCSAVLHVISRGGRPPESLREATPALLTGPLPREAAEWLLPLVVEGRRSKDIVLFAEPAVTTERFSIPFPSGNATIDVEVDGSLQQEVFQRAGKASSLLFNYGRRIGGGPYSNFKALYLQRPEVIEGLARRKIGVDEASREDETAWLARLPKVDLHCHLGGVADAQGLLEIAAALENEVDRLRRQAPRFDAWLKSIESALRSDCPIPALAAVAPDPKARSARTFFEEEGVQEPFAVAGVLQSFRNQPEVLDAFIFGAYQDPDRFRNVGFTEYESLGDLQGSGLLQTEGTIRALCRWLRRKAAEHRVRYLELRCSPLNYTRGGLTGRQVVRAILDELRQSSECEFRLLFIGSRHRETEQIVRHVQLALELLETSDLDFDRYFVGFDLAGKEAAGDLVELRRIFLPLMERCIRLTIHAGETESAESVWEAAYHLSADRIGHGLTLVERPNLVLRFLDRKIAVEMCPSSNRQILDFQDNFDRPNDPRSERRIYPLRRYLERGLRVTVNTDNPGISRTDWTQELHQAARLTPGGLSAWETLRLLRNGFVAAFDRVEERFKRLEAVEREVIEAIT